MANLVKKKFKIADMHCPSCAVMIDLDLEVIDGVISSKTSYPNCECVVEYDSEQINSSEVIKVIKISGYTSFPLDS